MDSRESNEADAIAFERLQNNPDYKRWVARLQKVVEVGEHRSASRAMSTPQDMAEHNYERGVHFALRRLIQGPMALIQPMLQESQTTKVA